MKPKITSIQSSKGRHISIFIKYNDQHEEKNALTFISHRKECCTKFQNMKYVRCSLHHTKFQFALDWPLYINRKLVSSFDQTRFKYVKRPKPATRAAPAATPLYAEAHASEYACSKLPEREPFL